MISVRMLAKSSPSTITKSPGFKNLLSELTALNIDDNLSSLSILSKFASLLFQRGVLFAAPEGEPVIMAVPFVRLSMLYLLNTKRRISLSR